MAHKGHNLTLSTQQTISLCIMITFTKIKDKYYMTCQNRQADCCISPLGVRQMQVEYGGFQLGELSLLQHVKMAVCSYNITVKHFSIPCWGNIYCFLTRFLWHCSSFMHTIESVCSTKTHIFKFYVETVYRSVDKNSMF